MKLARQLWIMALVAVVFACSEDDPLPLPTVDFKTDPAVVEVGVEMMFDNLSLNANSYEWDFGNGETSTEISPAVTYNAPGTYEVVLKAITQDGQEQTVTKSISVKQRYLTGYIVNYFIDQKGDGPWDEAEVDENDQRADVLLIMIVNKNNPTQAESENSVFDGIYYNAFPGSVNAGVSDDIILTNEAWAIVLSDWDGPNPEMPTLDDPFEDIIGATFNPVTWPSIKNTAGDAGYIRVIDLDDNGNILLDVDIFFELR